MSLKAKAAVQSAAGIGEGVRQPLAQIRGRCGAGTSSTSS